MGSDFPHKQEIAVEVIAEADVVVADNPASAAANGEIHHALAAGLLALDQVVPLGAIVSGSAAGRTGEDQITVCDLVGVGAQDAAIASEVVRLAEARGVGERFSR
jgi:ornithine cyclodeaminase